MRKFEGGYLSNRIYCGDKNHQTIESIKDNLKRWMEHFSEALYNEHEGTSDHVQVNNEHTRLEDAEYKVTKTPSTEEIRELINCQNTEYQKYYWRVVR